MRAHAEEATVKSFSSKQFQFLADNSGRYFHSFRFARTGSDLRKLLLHLIHFRCYKATR